VYPSQFEYHKPRSLAEAIGLLGAWRGDVRCLAGGHSLIPSMKLRLSQPRHLVDLAGIAELRGIRLEGRDLCVGAMSTHREVEASPVVAAHYPYLADVAGNIADPQVRNRGTIGGSLVNADPAADYPATLLALNGLVEVTGPEGARQICADDWPVSLMTTALREEEIVTRIRFPLPQGRQGAAYVKVPHPASRFAVVGVAVMIVLDREGACATARIAVTGVGETAQRVHAAEESLMGCRIGDVDIEAAAVALASVVTVIEDGLLSTAGKRQLCLMTARKALAQAIGLAGAR
jgi:carbon-monoxide dehydrogenase medium subunit